MLLETYISCLLSRCESLYHLRALVDISSISVMRCRSKEASFILLLFLFIYTISCISALPNITMVYPTPVSVTSSSVTIRLYLYSYLWPYGRNKPVYPNTVTKETGYQLQYHAKSTSQWKNGAQLLHDDWPHLNAT